MANMLKDMIDRLQGLDPEEEARNKQRAEQAQQEYEKKYGKVEEEPGIEEDYTIEELAANLSPAGVARMGAREATRGALKKLKDKMPERTMDYKTEINPPRPPAKEGPAWTEGRRPTGTRTEASTGFTNPQFKYEEEIPVTRPRFKKIQK